MTDLTQGKWYLDPVSGLIKVVEHNDIAQARLIAAAPEMYSELVEAVNVLRCAGVGDTRYALPKAHEIERLLKRIDGKEIQKGCEN